MRDIDVRRAVRRALNAQHAGDVETRIVEEMGIWAGSVRVDLAVINGELCGFELKSDSDTLKRLPNQADIYSKVFDRVTLVVGEKLYRAALNEIPRWWGCQVATMHNQVVEIRTEREAGRNATLDPNVLLQLLHRDEAVGILAECGLAKGWRSKRAAAINQRLIEELPFDDLCFHVRRALKMRVKLGQNVSGDFDVPVQIETDPCARTASGKFGVRGDPINLSVSPTGRNRVARGAQSDYLIGVPTELLIHGHSAWTFDLDPAKDDKLIGQRVLGIDGSEKVDIDRRPGSNAPVVTEIDTIGKVVRNKRAPESKLVSRRSRGPEREPAKRLRHGAAEDRHTPPTAPVVKRSKRVRNRDPKGRYIRDTVAEVDQ